MGKKTSVYLTDDLIQKLRLTEGRGLSSALHEVADRYQEMIGSERKRVEAMFSESEWNAMRNACNGTWWQPAATIRAGVLAKIQDSLDEEIQAFGAEREALESKLRDLTVVQQFTLVELIENWWNERTVE
ncbi:hypothetical protein [Alkalispirochaeta alkalica]|uniref:hypothetical protein n=1 Tax=Alkalispirochaeta alkalica TaxID=46356 RepID=UPI00036D57EA|nr:hypothetical protein [Alkalispirochaeta alkalica]